MMLGSTRSSSTSSITSSLSSSCRSRGKRGTNKKLKSSTIPPISSFRSSSSSTQQQQRQRQYQIQEVEEGEQQVMEDVSSIVSSLSESVFGQRTFDSIDTHTNDTTTTPNNNNNSTNDDNYEEAVEVYIAPINEYDNTHHHSTNSPPYISRSSSSSSSHVSTNSSTISIQTTLPSFLPTKQTQQQQQQQQDKEEEGEQSLIFMAVSVDHDDDNDDNDNPKEALQLITDVPSSSSAKQRDKESSITTSFSQTATVTYRPSNSSSSSTMNSTSCHTRQTPSTMYYFHEDATATTQQHNHDDDDEEEEDGDTVIQMQERPSWNSIVTCTHPSAASHPSKPTYKKTPVTPLTVIPYVHCGYAAAAPFMLQDSKWMHILQTLMPEAMPTLPTTHNQNIPLKIMKWAENNPIVAAYGILHSDAGRKLYKPQQQIQPKLQIQEHSHFATIRKLRRFGLTPTNNNTDNTTIMDDNHHTSSTNNNDTNNNNNKESTTRVAFKPALEWDVFLDPVLARQVDKAMDHAEELKHYCDEIQPLIAAEIEVDRQVGRLINRMMLAHGSTPQLVAEALGVVPRYNFSRVVEQGERSRRYHHYHNNRLLTTTTEDHHANTTSLGNGKTAAAGIFVERWLALFASAIQMAQKLQQSPSETDFNSHSLSSRSHSSKSRQQSNDDDDEEEEEYHDDEQDLESTVSIPFYNEQQEVSMPQAACGIFLCLGVMEDPNSKRADHANSRMAKSAKLIKKYLGGQSLKIVMDLKSRRVPPRVWARLIDNLKSRGLDIEGIGSFDHDELRAISDKTSTPVTPIHFFHSAGDLQRACHAQEVRQGDTVYFNAGSLIYKKPTLKQAANYALCNIPDVDHVDNTTYVSRKRVYNLDLIGTCNIQFQPYAYSRKELQKFKEKNQKELVSSCQSTLEDYQKHLDLNIGLYVQEFSIDKEHLNAISIFVNDHPSIYNLGLAYGGLNGSAIQGIQGDGFWNQRYVGRNWDFTAKPTQQMRLLAPEDHRFIQQVLHQPCGQVYQVNHVDEREQMADKLGICHEKTN